MKTTYAFDQVAHFRLLLEQKGVSPELLQEFYDSGAIADLLEVRKPKKLDREAVRKVYGLSPLDQSVAIAIPALPRPTPAELQSKFGWIKSIADTSPTEAVTLRLGTVLRAGENSIDGKEYERRLEPKQNILLGYQHAEWLVAHQEEFPDFMALLGKIYIDFPGLVVVGADGYRHYPCLLPNGGRWYLRWDWIESYFFSSDGRVACSSK